MKAQYFLIIIMTMLASLCRPAVLQAEDSLEGCNSALIELIQLAREQPLAVAEALGMDREKVLEDNSDIAYLLRSGFPQLALNQQLIHSSKRHNHDMLANNYLSHTSLEGKTVKDRIQESGYKPLVCGEKLNMITFKNFINSDTALFNIFKSIFKEELDPSYNGTRYLLNAQIRDFGVSLDSGKINLNGRSANAYIFTADFGTSELYKVERALFRIFNNLRSSPKFSLLELGLTEEQANRIISEHIHNGIEGLPLLAWSEELACLAASYSCERNNKDYWLSNQTVNYEKDTCYINGMRNITEVSSEMLASEVETNEGADYAARQICKSILLEYSEIDTPNLPLFDKNSTRVGISITRNNALEQQIETREETLEIIVKFAEAENNVPYVFGHIYNDLDNDGKFDIENEGIPNLLASNNCNVLAGDSVVTGLLGEFQLKGKSKIERLYILNEEYEILGSSVIMSFFNQRKDLSVILNED